MIRRIVLAALLVSSAGLAHTADPRPARGLEGDAEALRNEAADSYEALMAALEVEDARVRDQNKAVQASEEYQRAREANDRGVLDALRKEMERLDYKPFVERAVAGAKQFARTDGAIDFLGFTAQRGKGEQVREAIATLKADHLESAKIEKWVGLAGWYVRGSDRATVLDFLQAVDESNKHAKVRANAIYQIFRLLDRDRDATQEMKDAAAARLPEAAELAGEGQLRDRINAPMFEKERLQIGMIAPDIEGPDLDGVNFKLSDYRGKVVVLDFWGDW